MHIKLSFCRCSLLSNSFNHTFQVFVGRLVACLPTKTYQPHGWLALACLPSTNQLMKLGSWNWKILAVLEASASLTLKQLGNFFQNVFIFRFFFLKNIIFLYGTGGRFKNTYELLNLRALKISKLHKNHIFQCMGKIFCVEFQRVPLKFHTKYLTHTLKDVDFIHIWKFKSS